MEMAIEREGGTVVARLAGRIDGMAKANQFEESIAHATQHSDHGVVLECSAVSYMSSAGLRFIAMVANRMKKARMAFAVCGLNAQNREVFEISGFGQLFTITGDIEEALDHIASKH